MDITRSEVCFMSEGFEIRRREVSRFRTTKTDHKFPLAQTNAWPLLEQLVCLSM